VENTATKIMRLKHNLRAGAGEMNIVPNLHSKCMGAYLRSVRTRAEEQARGDSRLHSVQE